MPVATSPGSPAAAVALKHLGRFSHEAVAVDPTTEIVYETEDQGDVSGFYRFVPATKPAKPGDLAVTSSALEMMKVAGEWQYATGINQTIGLALPVEWVPIANPDPVPPTATIPDPVTNTTASGSAVFKQGFDLGGIRFRRLEGCWFADGKVFFISTNGGNAGFGQVFVYDPSAETLTLIAESPSHHVFDGPDNVRQPAWWVSCL